MLIGYMRVSKADGTQTLDLQRDALLAAGVKPGRLYEDHASGKRESRPGLDACLKALRKGDTLAAWKLDRLGRDLHHLVNLVHDLTGRGVGLKTWPAKAHSWTPRPPTAVLCSPFSPPWPSSSVRCSSSAHEPAWPQRAPAAVREAGRSR